MNADGAWDYNHSRRAETKEAVHTPHCLSVLATITRWLKAIIHYTSFPVASPQQVRNKLAAFHTGKLRGNVCNGFGA